MGFIIASQAKSGVQEVLDVTPHLVEVFLVMADDREVIHVTQVLLFAKVELHELIKIVQIDVSKELRGQVANRNPGAAADRPPRPRCR